MTTAAEANWTPEERAYWITRRRYESKRGFVYFVRPAWGPNPPIKVGTALDIAARMKSLQSQSPYPLKLLAATTGGPDYENLIHAKAALHRLHGEWFAGSSVPVWRAIYEALDAWGKPEGLSPPAPLAMPWRDFARIEL